MAEKSPFKDAESEWRKEKEPHDQWVRLYIFFKPEGKDNSEKFSNFTKERLRVMSSIDTIVRNLESEGILESFHFLFERFPDKRINENMRFSEFEFELRKYWVEIMDVRFWLKEADHIDHVKETIRNELNKDAISRIADYGFWLFPTQHGQYCTDHKSEAYYKILCKIFEYHCRLLLEKLNPESHANLEKDFNNVKILHRFLNSQGMSHLDETYLAILFALDKLKILEKKGKIFSDVQYRLFDALFMLEMHRENPELRQLPDKIYYRYSHFPIYFEYEEDGKWKMRGKWGDEDK